MEFWFSAKIFVLRFPEPQNVVKTSARVGCCRCVDLRANAKTRPTERIWFKMILNLARIGARKVIGIDNFQKSTNALVKNLNIFL